ncbi:MAG: molybdopterin-dependent oxidoreductase [Cyanobacteriota bacterium]
MKIIIPSISFGKKSINGNRATPKKTVRFPLFVAVFLSLGFGLSGCSKQLTSAELENLRQEAIARNQELITRYGKKPTQPNWQFRIQGQITTDKPVALSWSKLESLAKKTVWTTDPHHTSDRKAMFQFQGVPISTLLKEFGVASNVEDVTFVAYDAYRSTISLSDLRQYPILLALKRNNQKITRSDGGPIYLVFPHSQFPQLQQKYPDRYWAFYVTDMIVGTEPIKLQVGQQILDATTLNKLPPITIEETVGYRLGWPVGKVKLYGVRLRDVLAVAGVKLPQDSAVIVRGKSPIYHDSVNPIRIESVDIKRCDIVLATHWGDERKPIPAKMGGPVTLAFTSECQTPSDERRWVTFVEKLEVRK